MHQLKSKPLDFPLGLSGCDLWELSLIVDFSLQQTNSFACSEEFESFTWPWKQWQVLLLKTDWSVCGEFRLFLTYTHNECTKSLKIWTLILVSWLCATCRSSSVMYFKPNRKVCQHCKSLPGHLEKLAQYHEDNRFFSSGKQCFRLVFVAWCWCLYLGGC